MEYFASVQSADLEQRALTEIEKVIGTFPTGASTQMEVRSELENRFILQRWVRRPKVRSSGLVISFIKDDIGVCLQFGNVARVYADFLKLQTMFLEQEIGVACVIVPNDKYSRKLGSNLAAFSRTVRDMKTFEKVISAPMLVVSIGPD